MEGQQTMQRAPKYHSFPIFVLSFVIVGCVLIVLGLEFGWVQLEFDESNTGRLLAENDPSLDKNGMKLLKSIDIAVDSADREVGEIKNDNRVSSSLTDPEPPPFIAKGTPEKYPSRRELLQQLPAESERQPTATIPRDPQESQIKVVEYVERTSDPLSTNPKEIQNATTPQPPRLIPGTKLPFRRGTDLDGDFHRLGEDADVTAVTVIFLSPGCQFSSRSISQLNRIASVFEKKGIQFYGVISDRTTTRTRALEYRNTAKIDFPILFDTSGELRHQLRPTHTPQVFVIGHDDTLLYTGRIDDRFTDTSQRQTRTRQHHLTRALQAVTTGKKIRIAETEPIGSVIGTTTEDSTSFSVTYTRDIAPIIHAHCMNCHRPGEASPFPLTNYEEVSKRAGQINLVTKSRYMPPWKPVGEISHFQKELRLTDRKIELIGLWTETGNPHGNPSELPPTPTFPDGWQLGKPNFVVRVPETVHLPAERNDVYQYFVIPSEVVQDRLVSAVEFRPDNRAIIEYIALTCDTTGTARELDAADPSPGYQRAGGPGFQPESLLGRWIPGARPHRYPQAIGRRIPAGVDLVLGIHYRPSGKVELDRSKVGIHFASRDNRIASTEILVAKMDLAIPAGEEEFRHVAIYRLPLDVTLHSVSPHMRRLGRGIKVSALLPNGSNFPLIQIDDWDFQWQSRYLLSHPLRLPQGARIEVEAVFDNSEENPYNPHLPPQSVQWGDRAVDEIALCFFDVTTARPQDIDRLSQHNKQYLIKQSQLVQEPAKSKSGNLQTPRASAHR
jgi:hypothetical protein